MSEQKLGKYTLIREIARGGMAEIWLAEQRGPGGFNKELVIKKILPHLAEEDQMTEMFLDEARLVAELSHPNIGQVYELGEQEGVYYIAMEYIDGLNLAQLLKKLRSRGTFMPVEYAARICSDILAALDFAHNYVNRDGVPVRLVHRDISPHNVLLSNDGAVKLVDFGVAKAQNQSHKTETGAVKGKFAYMAPEQIESKDLDGRVDVFAVGVVLYELLTGEKPFGDDLKAISMILSAVSPDPRDSRTDIPDEVAAIIDIALKRDRDERYQSAAEMEAALQGYLQREQKLVRTRDLSAMVRQIRELGSGKPTEQLFGFEKLGVEKSSPRMTVQQYPDPNESALDAQVAEKKESKPSPKVRLEGQFANEENPTRREGSMTAVLAAEAKSEGMSLGLIAGFVVLALLVLVAAVVALFLFLQSNNHEGGITTEPLAEVEATDEPVEQAAPAVPAEEPRESTRPSWRHNDGLVVFINSNVEADLYRLDEKVGTTPFQTLLRPGRYFVELRSGETRKSVEFVVEEENPIQRYRFDL